MFARSLACCVTCSLFEPFRFFGLDGIFLYDHSKGNFWRLRRSLFVKRDSDRASSFELLFFCEHMQLVPKNRLLAGLGNCFALRRFCVR